MLADHAAIPVLAVTDLDRAREFYEGTLGFTSGPEVPDGVIYRTSNGGFLVYPSAYAGTNKATGISFQLSADAFDTEVAALRAAGIQFQTFDLPGDATWTDGSTQITIDGRPIYTFAQDAAPGDVTGQGVNDVWYVIAPDGSEIDDDRAQRGVGRREVGRHLLGRGLCGGLLGAGRVARRFRRLLVGAASAGRQGGRSHERGDRVQDGPSHDDLLCWCRSRPRDLLRGLRGRRVPGSPHDEPDVGVDR